jgi:hypothetical protein
VVSVAFHNNAILIEHYFLHQFLCFYEDIGLEYNLEIYINLCFAFILISTIQIFDKNFQQLILLAYFISKGVAILVHSLMDYKIIVLSDTERLADSLRYIHFPILWLFFSKY